VPEAPRCECKRRHAHETYASAIEPGPLARGRRAARCTAGFGGAKPFNYFCYGAAASEVELDALTGDWHLLRTDLAMDVGDSLNPAIDIGQARARARASRVCRVFTHRLGSVAGAWRTGRAAFVECGFSVVALRNGLMMPLGDPQPTQPGQPGHDDAHRRACRPTASRAATMMRVRAGLGSRVMPRLLMLLCNAYLKNHRKWQLGGREASFHSTHWTPFWALHESHDSRAGPMAALQACSGARRCGPGRRRGTARRAQVEGGLVQGLGWCCLEELVWGDAAHPWVPPGTLHTRGPGARPLPHEPSPQGRPPVRPPVVCCGGGVTPNAFARAGTYKIPTVNDIPLDLRVTLLRDAPCAQTPLVHSSKAVGEPPLFLGASVFFALKARARSCSLVPFGSCARPSLMSYSC